MKKGFTFIELVLFIACTSVIASIAAPTIFKTCEESRQNQCRSNMMSLATGEALYYAQYGEYGSIMNLVSTGIMPGAADLHCPIPPDMVYTYVQLGDTYRIFCPYLPGTGASEHGYIDTGVPSWE